MGSAGCSAALPWDVRRLDLFARHNSLRHRGGRATAAALAAGAEEEEQVVAVVAAVAVVVVVVVDEEMERGTTPTRRLRKPRG